MVTWPPASHSSSVPLGLMLLYLKASYTSTSMPYTSILRPHTLVVQDLLH
jgi:hypothetical protein